jgi:hypothetical protein
MLEYINVYLECFSKIDKLRVRVMLPTDYVDMNLFKRCREFLETSLVERFKPVSVQSHAEMGYGADTRAWLVYEVRDFDNGVCGTSVHWGSPHELF